MIKQRNAQELAKGYPSWFRILEILALAAFGAISLHLFYKSANQLLAHPFVVISAICFGLVSADLVSGLVHWAADTWGSPEWPIVGKALIRPFREHHVDPMAMTRHDFIESSGANCLISMPVLLAVEFVNVAQGPWSLFIVGWQSSMVFFVFLTAFTHKWAHYNEGPLLVRSLQKAGLVLSKSHHDRHHEAPFNQNYCITTGWLNPVLTKLQIFPWLERQITNLTGAIPRQDDIGKNAAIQIALANGVLQEPSVADSTQEMSHDKPVEQVS